MSETQDNKDDALYIFKKTRKAFIFEYVCGVILLFLPTLLILNGIHLKSTIANSFFLVGIGSILSAEFLRILTRYKITEDKMVITEGIIKQRKKNVYFAPLGFLPNINFRQSRMQRFLNYGTVYISSGANEENNFEIKDIDKPHRVLEIIEELINIGRKKSHGLIKDEE